MIKLLIYDLDGTLIDSRLDIASAVNWSLKKLDFRELLPEQIISFVGSGVRELFGSCFQAIGICSDECLVTRGVRYFKEYYSGHCLDATILYPSVRHVLEYFKNCRQAVVTNKPDEFSRKILDGLGVAGCFFRIIGDNAGYEKKPSPESVFEVIKSAGVLPGETVFIGDSDIDVETGKSAGVKTILVTYGFGNLDAAKRLKPDLIVDDLKEILESPLFSART